MWDNFWQGASNAVEGVKNVIFNLGNYIVNILAKAWQKVKDVFSTGGKIFTGIKDGIVTAFKAIVNAIIGGINQVISIPFNKINDVLTSIRNFDIPVVGRVFSWLPSLPVPQIPKLAKGGIVAQPTMAVVGEAGREAVMPLENNLEWLDILADKLASRIGSNGGSYIIQLDGRTIQRGQAKKRQQLAFETNGGY